VEIKMTNLEMNYLNLGTYAFGTLELPATEEEINAFFERINPNGRNDVELQYVVTELGNSDLDKLTFDQLKELSEMDEDEAETLISIYEAVDSYDEALEVYNNGEYILYDNCDDMSDVAYSWIHDHVGSLEDAVSKDRMNFYIDADQIKRDLDIDGYWYELEEEQGEEMDDHEKDCHVESMIDEGIFTGEQYFDYEAFGRDMEIEGHFHYLGNSVYIQIWQ
jgi:hypothetical protein